MAENAPPGRLLALDLETTGFDPRRDAIVAVGCVPIVERSILWGEAYRALVDDPRSGRPRDVAALGVHQVLPEEQRGGLGLAALLELAARHLDSGAVLLVHGAAIERGFLEAAARAVGGRLPALRTVDTLAFLRAIERVRPHVAERLPAGAARHAEVPASLGAARSFFGLPAYPEHDPLYDALGTAELYLLLSRRFPELHPRVQS